VRIFNTLTRALEEFAPLEGGHARLYTCGPTVYNYAHIGNFRAYLFEDLLRRHLKCSGYRVTQVMNLTDVDDKTIRGAREGGVSLDAFTRPFKAAFFDDLKALNIEPAEHYPAATDHVPEMIALIRRLFDAGYAYRSEDGSVYYNVGRFAAYGRLAHLDVAGLRAGARVAQDEYDKANVADFALWKAWDESDGAVAWDSPWGRGRPGWHIECSAMSMKYLGESFDLHTGGVDNIFPHHENEIAQSEGATGKLFVRYWMHCGYLVVDGAKMAKSLGNFHTLRDLLARGFAGREIRYLLMSGHYRQPLNFTFDALNGAKAALARLDDFRERVEQQVSGGGSPGAGTDQGRAPAWALDGRRRFREALDEDLGMPEALSALFDMVHAGNRAMDAGELAPDGAAGVLAVLDDMDRVLGYLRQAGEQAGDEIRRLADDREAARQAGNWTEADRLRRRIGELGWEIRDTAEGPKLKKK
jgi:cysteinyl-tRNA synthetase